MEMPLNSNHIPIIGQNKILVTLVPGQAVGTFDVIVDTSNFSYGIPLAVQCLLQATTFLVPRAFTAIANAGDAL